MRNVEARDIIDRLRENGLQQLHPNAGGLAIIERLRELGLHIHVILH